MLDEYRHSFEACANSIPNWKTVSKNELCNKYIEVETSNSTLAEAYLAAILCRYWTAIDSYYAKSYTCASPEDCYDWLLHAVTYALKHRKWTDPSCSVYGDPNGPDKVINRCIKSTRLIYYTASNRQKRKYNATLSSVEQLQENIGDAWMPEVACQDDIYIDFTKDIITQAFKEKDYFLAFMVDAICHLDVFDITVEKGKTYSQFSQRKLVKHLKHIDDEYCLSFAKQFELDFESVKFASKYCTELSSDRIYTKIKNNLRAIYKNRKRYGLE